MEPARPSALDLAAYAGEYISDEAELTLRVTAQDGALTVHRRPETKLALTPTFKDAFTSELGGIQFLRDARGAVREMSVSQDRVWDLRFKKAPGRGQE
jgi:hypothetical protein